MNRKGNRTRKWPIKRKEDINTIKDMLYPNPRNYALFVLGINTGYRAIELSNLRVRDVRYLEAGDTLEVWQTKTSKYRRVKINAQVHEAIQRLLDEEKPHDNEPLFRSRKFNGKLCVETITRLLRDWCKFAGLQGNFGSHTLRKTWGYHQRKNNAVPIHILMVAFGHTTQAQTLNYLCIEMEEVEELFQFEI